MVTYTEQDQELRSEQCGNRIRALLCACFWEHREYNQGNVQEALFKSGYLYDMIISEHEGPKFAPSDNVVGLQLVRMLQKHYFHHGREYFRSANPREKVNKYSAPPTEKLSTVSWGSDLLPDRYKNGYKKQEPTVDLCFQGLQPQLTKQDWNNIADIKYYLKYTIGVYGLPLHLLGNFCCGLCAHPPCCKPSNVN
eukprot:UN32604